MRSVALSPPASYRSSLSNDFCDNLVFIADCRYTCPLCLGPRWSRCQIVGVLNFQLIDATRWRGAAGQINAEGFLGGPKILLAVIIGRGSQFEEFWT